MEVSMMSELSGNITSIRFEPGSYFTVELEGASDSPVIADNQTNQLAIDAAFERRAPVVLQLEGARIRRVQSNPPRDKPDAPPRREEAVFVTRISTQVVATGLIAEVFYRADPAVGDERQALTKDPVIHLLCHGAYVSEHPLVLELADSEIKAVQKEHVAD
jgi:hypothetical protein